MEENKENDSTDSSLRPSTPTDYYCTAMNERMTENESEMADLRSSMEKMKESIAVLQNGITPPGSRTGVLVGSPRHNLEMEQMKTRLESMQLQLNALEHLVKDQDVKMKSMGEKLVADELTIGEVKEEMDKIIATMHRQNRSKKKSSEFPKN